MKHRKFIFQDYIDGELNNTPAVYTVSDDGTFTIIFDQDIPVTLGDTDRVVSKFRVQRKFVLQPWWNNG